MKLYRTSFLSVTALMMLLSCVLLTQKVSASCGSFTISTQDTSWSFSAAAGSSQSRTLTITNTSGADLTLSFTTGSDAFIVLEHTQITIPASGDSGRSGQATITIKFAPGANATGT